MVRLFVNQYPDYTIINLDALTYAGNLENLKDVESKSNYRFVKADILKTEELERVFAEYAITDIIHLAAESHVDRSIVSPLDFVYTNIIGTVNLLNIARKQWALIIVSICSIIYLLMKYLEAWVRQGSLPKQQLTIPDHPILPVRPLPIIL